MNFGKLVWSSYSGRGGGRYIRDGEFDRSRVVVLRRNYDGKSQVDHLFHHLAVLLECYIWDDCEWDKVR